MKKFLICLSPFLITAVTFFALDFGSGENYEYAGEWFIPVAILLIGFGAVLSAVFTGIAVHARMKGSDGVRVSVAVLVGMAVAPLYVAASFGGCVGLSTILGK